MTLSQWQCACEGCGASTPTHNARMIATFVFCESCAPDVLDALNQLFGALHAPPNQTVEALRDSMRLHHPKGAQALERAIAQRLAST